MTENDAKPLHPAWLGVMLWMALPWCVVISIGCWLLAVFFGLL
jgi:hypothetical protein